MNSRTGETAIDSGDISRAELLPFLLPFGDLRRRAFLLPGLTAAVFGVTLLLFAGLEDEHGFFWCLGSFISLGNLYMLYLWCGMKMPFPYVFAVAVFAFFLDLLLLAPLAPIEKMLPSAIAPGLIEEPMKALPLLIILALGRFLPHAQQRKYAIREPLDAILLATASATGFAFLETMFIYMPKYGALISAPRLLVNSFGHIAYSVAFAYFIGLAALHHRRIGKVVLALAIGFYGDGLAIVSPLHEVIVALLSFIVLASMILKAREISPEREFLWPFGSMAPYHAPRVAPLPPLPALPGDIWLMIGDTKARLTDGGTLTEAELPGLKARTADSVVAEIRPHPTEPRLLVLRNLSRSSWEAVLPDGTVRHVDPAGTVRLTDGTRIDFGEVAGAIVFTPHNPDSDPPPRSPVEWC